MIPVMLLGKVKSGCQTLLVDWFGSDGQLGRMVSWFAGVVGSFAFVQGLGISEEAIDEGRGLPFRQCENTGILGSHTKKTKRRQEKSGRESKEEETANRIQGQTRQIQFHIDSFKTLENPFLECSFFIQRVQFIELLSSNISANLPIIVESLDLTNSAPGNCLINCCTVS